MISVCKTFEFEAAHNLPDHEGACRRVHGHGYKLEIEVSGRLKTSGSERGMIIDFGKLKRIVNAVVVGKLDHTMLNTFFLVPTAEEMVLKISQMLQTAFTADNLKIKLVRVRLWETSTSSAEWRRDK